MAQFHIQLVGYYRGVYPRHIFVAPCEYLIVSPKECHQLLFLFFGGVVTLLKFSSLDLRSQTLPNVLLCWFVIGCILLDKITHVMMLFNRVSVTFKVFLFRVILLEDSTHIPSQRNWIPYIRLDDVVFSLDAQLSKHHPSGRRELSIWTFLYVENLRTVLGSIRLDVSAARPDAFQCSTTKRTLFQNTNMGRLLQLSRRCVFPSGRSP